MAKSDDNTLNENRKTSTGELALASEFVSITSPKDMQTLANTLKTFIVENELYTEIGNDDDKKKHIHVEGWQFAGASMGIFPMVTETKRIEVEGTVKYQKKEWYKDKNTGKNRYNLVDADSPVYKYEATVELININTGRIVGRGVALCSNEEAKKRTFDEYAVLSMAETRATSKAFRLTLGWVMKLAGYSATPAEEMDADEPEDAPVDEPGTYTPHVSDEDIKVIVTAYLSHLTSGDKIKFLKHNAGTVSEGKLDTHQYRLLFEAIAAERERAKKDEVQSSE